MKITKCKLVLEWGCPDHESHLKLSWPFLPKGFVFLHCYCASLCGMMGLSQRCHICWISSVCLSTLLLFLNAKISCREGK